MNTNSENFMRYQQCISRAYDLMRDTVDSRVIPLLPLLLLTVRRFTNINLLASNRSNTHDFVYLVLRQVQQEASTPLIDELSSSVEAVFGHTNLSFYTIERLIHILDEVPVDALSEAEYVRLIDDAINNSERFSGQRGESRLVPNSLAKLVSQIYAIPAHARVFNPIAGSAQLAAYLPATSQLVLQEYSHEWRILAILRLLAHNFFKSTITLGSPLEQWPTQQWEYILSTEAIPSNNWRAKFYHPELPANPSADIVFVHQVLQHLTPDGRAVIPVFANFLWQSSNAHRRFREMLITSGALEAVVEFPAGVIPSSSVRLGLLLLRSARSESNEVLLLDAEAYTQRKGRQVILDTPALLDALARPADLPTARFMAPADLAKHHYELSARRYLVQQEPNSKQIRLNQVVEPIPMRAERALPPEGRFIRIRDLKSDNVDFTLTSMDVEMVPLSSRALVPLAEDALLVALQGGVLKPTWYVHQPGQVVYLPPSGILALRLRREMVSVEYLVVELQTELVLQQIRAVSTGAVMPAIRKGDLLQLIIRLPALDEQQDAVERTREQVGKVKKQETEASQATRAIKAKAFAQFASLKHALGQPQQNLASGVAVLESVIRRYAAENRVLSLTSRLNEARDATVQDTLDALKQAVQFIFTTLDRNDHELVLEDFPKELVEMTGYLRRLISRTDALHLGFSVSYALDDPNLMAYYYGGDESEEMEMPTVYVRANENLLDRLFDHILNNARRHGFQNASSSTNRVVFEVTILASMATDLNGADLCIRVSNNGRPFPLNFDPNSLFRKNESAGETGNTGIGGYEAKEIVNYFDGTIEASTGRHPDFPVEYTITLPIEASEYTNNESEDV